MDAVGRNVTHRGGQKPSGQHPDYRLILFAYDDVHALPRRMDELVKCAHAAYVEGKFAPDGPDATDVPGDLELAKEYLWFAPKRISQHRETDTG